MAERNPVEGAACGGLGSEPLKIKQWERVVLIADFNSQANPILQGTKGRLFNIPIGSGDWFLENRILQEVRFKNIFKRKPFDTPVFIPSQLLKIV